MNNHSSICDPQRVEGCLSSLLNDEEQSAFEAHLEVCSVCRQSLEGRAAPAADWQSAREFLNSDAKLPLAPKSNSDSYCVASSADLDSAETHQREAVDAVLSILAPTDDPRMLGRLGGYEIAGVVGRGGMGVVLKALDPALNRYVAIKVLAPQLATSGAARQRFSREARAAASVVHENVVAIHAVADSGPLPYFVMPYLRGSSLQKRLDANGPLGVSEILRVGVQIAAGLSAAHSQGLVHRDIKPANIMLEDGVERLKITDFGLARAADDASLTRTGVIAGTPQFMSPEQARGELVDSRSDLFSLGSVMYAMCTGRPPFRAETSYGTLQRICDGKPHPIPQINPDIPLWLIAVIEHLHQKDADDRFQTAPEVAHLLEQCLAHLRQPEIVSLPAAVKSLVAKKSPASPTRRAAWHYWHFPRRAASLFSMSRSRLLAAASILGVIAIVITAICIKLWPGMENPGRPFAPDSATMNQQAIESPQDNLSQTPIETATPPTGWDNDDLARQIDELQFDVSRLENRVSSLESAAANTAQKLDHQIVHISPPITNLDLPAPIVPTQKVKP
jgi:eukaryotic-like serine/threonine-protein kinase